MTLSNSNHLGGSEDVKSQLAELDKQLISFEIVDRQGISRGKIQDVYYDSEENLNLLVGLGNVNDRLNLRRLKSEDICQLDIERKQIISSLSNQEIENLSIYQPVSPHIKNALAESSEYNDREMNPNLDRLKQSNNSEAIKISLLEEKLQVTRHKQKIGEVIVRKQIETKLVQIPIRREKLIIERVGKNTERLTEVVINDEKVNGFGYDEIESDNHQLYTIVSKHIDLEKAQSLLADIAHSSSTNNPKICIEIITNNSEVKQKYQNICDRY